jgi:NAD(P)-dependent dehydrogenase (short-subunit alcohol dehydrogenase family)
VQCDLSDFASIRSACEEVKSRIAKLDVVINNAGIWNFSYRESKNGIEEILHVNVLAPLLITHLLVDLLEASSEAKVIFASSGLHQGEVQFSDLEFKSDFSGFKSYRQSKLMIILITRLLANRLASRGIGVYCEHPGLVSTKLSRDAGWFSAAFFKLMGTRPEKGAETLVFIAQERKDALVSGEYYHNKVVTKTTPQSDDLVVAEKVLGVSQGYLKDFLGRPSPVFPGV